MSDLDIECKCISCRNNKINETKFDVQGTQLLANESCDVNKRYERRVDTSNLYRTINLPSRFEHSYIFSGYGCQRRGFHPAFKTTSSDYGYIPPNAHTVPHRYYPRSNEFSTVLAKCGMYRNYSLNTIMDK